MPMLWPFIPADACKNGGDFTEPLRSRVNQAIASSTNADLLDKLASQLDMMIPPCPLVSARVRLRAHQIRTQFAVNRMSLGNYQRPNPIVYPGDPTRAYVMGYPGLNKYNAGGGHGGIR